MRRAGAGDFAYCDRSEVLLKSLSQLNGWMASATMPGFYEAANKLASAFM